MSSTQPGRTAKTRRHLHYVLRMANPEPRTPMFDSVESWNWAVRISVVGLFVLALAVIAFKMASVVVPVVLAWVVAMVLLSVVDHLERRGLSRALTSIVLVILLIASIVVIVGVLTVPLTYWLRRGSELGALLKERLETLGNPLAFFDTSIYFGTLTVVNICLGIAATVLTWLVGLPHPFLWGMLAAVLNFIPYVGAAIVIATLLVVGLIVFSSLGHAVIAPLAYLGITALEGQCITPTLLGHRLTINPFLVFLSIACWSWMWGPVGAFLGVPILLCAMVAVRRLASTADDAGLHATAADRQAS